MHIELDDDLVAEVDRLAGPRGRSEFVRDALRAAVDRQLRAQSSRRAAGTVDDGHDWDCDCPPDWPAIPHRLIRSTATRPRRCTWRPPRGRGLPWSG
ncbi:ribbon-helix-helix domain-containing protein [Sporichthya brevicatena]|uniref:CopG family ribbon-helix-helix protein n=1 Tax=Sporichthya brevicatena TaxID=171442 RepID=UPI0031E11DFB